MSCLLSRRRRRRGRLGALGAGRDSSSCTRGKVCGQDSDATQLVKVLKREYEAGAFGAIVRGASASAQSSGRARVGCVVCSV